jgi:flagellar biosynthesis GTPase FlhF
MENEGLREALKVKKKQGKKGKPLPLIQRKETRAGTQWWSPSKVSEARWRDKVFTREAEAEKFKKVDAKKLRESNKLLKDKLDQEKREKRAREKEERDKARAKEREEVEARKAERQRKKEKKDREKALHLSQSSKRKASKPLARPKKKQRCGAAARRGPPAAEPVLEVPTCTTRSGRTSTLPARFIYERILSHRYKEQPTKETRDNSFCVWLYSLIFARC